MNISLSLKNKGVTPTLFRYAFPSILSMWIFSFYTMVDGIFVGRGVGPDALAAVNIAMPFTSFTFALSIMTSIGASTIISKYLGKRDIQSARDLFTHTLIFLGGAGLLICGLGIFFRYELASFLGAKGHMVPLVVEYLETLLVFNTFYLLAYALEVLIKVEGKPGVAMVVVGAAALTNILLDYLLVIVFPMGLRGAAIATGMAQLIQGLILFGFFIRKNSILKLQKVKFNLKKILPIIKIGVPDSITELSVGLAIYFFNQSLFKYYGLVGITAFTVIGYINSFILFTMIGITQGMQPIMSFLDGKGERLLKSQLLKVTLKSTAILGILSAILIYFNGRYIISLFIIDDSISDFTLRALYIFSPTFIIAGINVVISGYFTALENTKYAFIISVLRGVILVPLLLTTLPVLINSRIIWSVTFISEILTLIFASRLIKK